MKKILYLLPFLLLVQSAHASGGIGPGPQPDPVRSAQIKEGLAYPAPGTPPRIKKALRAANKIARKPYRWSGGHALWRGNISSYIRSQRGFDCSGSVSFVLGSFGGGWIKRPHTSGSFARWGRSGVGRWFTVYASSGHAYLVIAGLRFDTSGLSERSTRWSRDLGSSRGFVARRALVP